MTYEEARTIIRPLIGYNICPEAREPFFQLIEGQAGLTPNIIALQWTAFIYGWLARKSYAGARLREVLDITPT